MKEIIINEGNFAAEVLNSDKPVIVDFWAEWCGPCKMQAPLLAEFAETHDDVKVGKVDIMDQPAMAVRFGIMSIPTLILFRDGKPVAQRIGLQNETQLEALAYS